METPGSEHILRNIEHDVKILRTLTLTENNYFLASGYRFGLVAYDIFKGTLQHKVPPCFPTSLAFTHGIRNPLISSKNEHQELRRHYEKIGSVQRQKTSYHEVTGYEPILPRTLINIFNDTKLAWITLQTRPRPHCLGLRLDTERNIVMLWDTSTASPTIRHAGQFSYLRSIELNELAKKINSFYRDKSVPIRIVTFS